MKKLYIAILLFTSFCFIPGFSDPRSPEWEYVRKAFIKNHPACALCGTAKDLQVHHIKPFHLYPELELEPENLVTLCTSKYWGFSCHLVAGHGGNFRYENPWILEDIENLKIIGNPQYIKEDSDEEYEEYIKFIKKRVKEYNLKQKEYDEYSIITGIPYEQRTDSPLIR